MWAVIRFHNCVSHFGGRKKTAEVSAERTSVFLVATTAGFRTIEMKFRNTMNSLILIGVLLAGSCAEDGVLHDYVSFVDEEFSDTFLGTDNKINKTKVQSQNKDMEEENSKENSDNLLESFFTKFNRNPDTFPTATKITSDNFLLQHLSEIHRTHYPDNNDNRTGQVLIRREINDPWQSPIDIVDADTFPWNYDSYYSREPKYVANDYGDYSNSGMEVTQQKNASAFNEIHKEYKIQEQQQHWRNDHYNEYNSMGNHKNFEANDMDDLGKRRGNFNFKKYLSKNPCRQYLEFLRYAFEKLDEGYDYEDDYNYNNDDKLGREKLPGNFPYRMYSRMNTDDLPLLPVAKDKESVNGEWTPEQNWPSQTSSTSPSSYSSSISPSPFTLGISHGNLDQITTLTPWSRISESYSSTSQTTKETVTEIYSTTPSPTESPTSLTPMLLFEGKEHAFDGNYFTATQERYSTKFQDFERTTASLPTPGSPFTAVPRWLLPENHFRNLGNGMSRMSSATPTKATNSPNWVTYDFITNKDESFLPTLRMSTEESTEASKKDDNDCNDKILPCPDTYNITYPLNGYCNRYVSCESGRAVRRTCPEGLHFNILTKSCDLPHNSFCNYACSEPEGYYGIPGDCGGYFVCKNSLPEYRMCPPRMHWDTAHDVCTFVESSTCPMKCTQVNEILHYEGDCKAYIICLNGLPYYHKCPPNTKFDRLTSTCVPSHLSKCEDDPKLMTRILNPNLLCKNMQIKFGSESWCDYYKSKELKV